MEQTLRQRLVGVWLGTAAVLVSSFIPWGTFTVKPVFTTPGSGAMSFSFPIPGLAAKVTLTGWVGTVSFFGVAMPTWFSIALAIAAAVVATLRVTNAWDPPRWLPMALAGLGFIQVLGITLVLAAGRSGATNASTSATIDGGIVMAIASFIFLIAACRRMAPPSVQVPA